MTRTKILEALATIDALVTDLGRARSNERKIDGRLAYARMIARS